MSTQSHLLPCTQTMQRLLVPDHGDYEEANVIFVANDQDDLCVSLWPHTGVVVHKQHTAALGFQVGFMLVVLTWQGPSWSHIAVSERRVSRWRPGRAPRV